MRSQSDNIKLNQCDQYDNTDLLSQYQILITLINTLIGRQRPIPASTLVKTPPLQSEQRPLLPPSCPASSSSGDTWTPTSTGSAPFLAPPPRQWGGWGHCFLLCWMKRRMSPSGRLSLQRPQVRRSRSAWGGGACGGNSTCCCCCSASSSIR